MPIHNLHAFKQLYLCSLIELKPVYIIRLLRLRELKRNLVIRQVFL